MINSNILYCCSCGRQIKKKGISSDKLEAPLYGFKLNFGNTIFCGDCAKDLDENGLFPEERHN